MAILCDSWFFWGLAIVIASTSETLSHATPEPETNSTWMMVSGISTEVEVYSTLVNEVTDDGIPSGLTWEWYPLVWEWWVIIQAVSSLLGIVGNGIVIVVIYQRISSSRSTDGLIGALAIGDFLTSVFLFPIPWAKTVPGTILGHLYCKILYPSFILWLCITASTYVLMALCVERYLAVVHPLFFNRIITKRKVSLAITIMWVLSFLQISYTLFTFVYDYDIGYCSNTIDDDIERIVTAYSVIITRLILPVMTMMITQILIARSLHQQAKHFNVMTGQIHNPANPSFHVVARDRVIKMMLIVVIVYVITWTPNQIAYICFNLGYISSSYRGSPLHRILTVIAFANSFANPFIYAASNRNFRLAILNLFSCSGISSRAPIFEDKMKSSKFAAVISQDKSQARDTNNEYI